MNLINLPMRLTILNDSIKITWDFLAERISDTRESSGYRVKLYFQLWTVSNVTVSIVTVSIVTVSIVTVSIVTVSIVTVSIVTVSNVKNDIEKKCIHTFYGDLEFVEFLEQIWYMCSGDARI